MAIRLEFSAEQSDHPNGAWILYWSADLLFRMFNDVEVDVGATVVSPVNPSLTLADELGRLRSDIPLPPNSFGAGLHIAITPVHGGDCITLWADGWTVWINRDAEAWHQWNPLSAATAASIGAALTIKAFSSDLASGLVWSIRSRTASPEKGSLHRNLRIPPTYIAGIGAVGSSFVQALRPFEITGVMHLADNQNLSATNLLRYVGTCRADINRSKATRAATLLKACGADSNSYECPAQDVLQRFPHNGVLISAVDTAPARRALAENLPPIVLDAGVSDDEPRFELLRASFPPDGPCLACYYPRTAVETSREEEMATALGLAVADIARMRTTGAALSTTQIQSVEDATSQPLPPQLLGENIDTVYTRHYCGGAPAATQDESATNTRNAVPPEAWTPIPALAGVLLATEYVLQCGDLTRAENFFTWDLRRAPNPGMNRTRSSRSDCHVCADLDFLSVFRERYQVTQ